MQQLLSFSFRLLSNQTISWNATPACFLSRFLIQKRERKMLAMANLCYYLLCILCDQINQILPLVVTTFNREYCCDTTLKYNQIISQLAVITNVEKETKKEMDGELRHERMFYVKFAILFINLHWLTQTQTHATHRRVYSEQNKTKQCATDSVLIIRLHEERGKSFRRKEKPVTKFVVVAKKALKKSCLFSYLLTKKKIIALCCVSSDKVCSAAEKKQEKSSNSQ